MAVYLEDGVSPGMDRLAVSARFPRDVAGSPALALGTGCSPGDPFAPAQNRQNRPPNGLQGPRSSRAGWSVRSWPAASATPVQQLPHRVPVDLHPRPRGTAALHIECSFPWGCGADRARDSLLPAGPPGKRPERAAASPACPCVRAFLLPRKSWAAARNRSIPRTADGNLPTRRTASCRLWRRWLLGGTVLDTCYGAAGVSMWNQRERSPGPAPLMALIR